MKEDKKGFWSSMMEQGKIEEEKSKLRRKGIKLDYLGGHPKLKKGNILVAPSTENNSLELDKKYIVNVTKIEWDEKGKRSAGKAAAGAIVGGVLTGGVGAIAGAAIGGRKKDDSLAVITFREGASVVEHTMYFRCNQKEYQKLASLL